MKKITATILLALISISVFSQTDPIIVGAIKYLKKGLKDPASYIGYGAKKYSWRLSDSLEIELSSINSKIKYTVITTDIKEYELDINYYKTQLEKEKSSFVYEYRRKTEFLKSEYDLYKQYSDSIKFSVEFEKVKKGVLSKLQASLVSEARMLENAKAEGDIYWIKRWSEKIEEDKKNIENIDEYVIERNSYGNNIIKNYIKFKKLEKEYFEMSKDLLTLESDTSKIIDIFHKHKEQFMYSSSLGYYSEKIDEKEKKIRAEERRLENKKLEVINLRSEAKLISDKLILLEKNPQANKILYYYVVIDYSATNTYGGRIRDKETVHYRKGEYWID